MPVAIRNRVSEWSRSHSRRGPSSGGWGERLSAEPFSYRYLVATTVTTTPVQSAMAFPKKEPMCVCGLERLYSTIHRTRIETAAMLNECCFRKLGLRLMQAPAPGQLKVV